MVSSDPPDDNLYRIGTVASLTGISVERLRAWERRHALSPAHKSGKTRFYSKPQLDRLRLIKHLIDQGHPISSLAPLSHEQLTDRIEAEREQQPMAQPIARVFGHAQVPRIGLVGANVLMLEQQLTSEQTSDAPKRVEVVSRWANMQAFESEQSAADDPQVLVLQLPVLSIQPIDLAREFYPESRIVVIYQFATSAIVSDTQRLQVPVLKWPVTWGEIEHVCANEAGFSNSGTMALPRRYSDEELIAIAANSKDPTQCPQYLVEAINQLNAFVTYTAECVAAGSQLQTNDKMQAYETVHADATQARAQLEAALELLVEPDCETTTPIRRTTH